MKRLGIYVQVPFCQTKCTYCNFHTGVVAKERFTPYVEAVCKEIRQHTRLLRAAGVDWKSGEWRVAGGVNKKTDYLVDTLYFGGGTPSLLDVGHLNEIVQAIRQAFAYEFEEVTLEADPETVEEEKAAAWVRAGIDRVSFGVQSFSDKELAAAGRMHRRADVYRAVPILRDAGIRSISFDLIAGLPHQTNASWKQSLAELIALVPEHVSVYLLEVDEGSRLGKELLAGGARYSAPAVPTEDEMAELYETAQKELRAAGYLHYEISNWAKPGFESKHNLKYWRREPYLGFGAGAHSFSGMQRWANAHDAATYVSAIEYERSPLEQLESLTAEQALEEELFLGLRQLNGIDVGKIEKEYGVALRGRFEHLAAAGLVEREGGVVRLAEKRLSVSNEVFVELMK
ncbi:MAG TPA: radical SAM family heme chaperone HemW [Candidatus Acidoferrum sp.]|nr:radical SAM family heme chaperone HemW [Candidatus Acidoferrum sp.]